MASSLILSKHVRYSYDNLQLSWFGAQKFCRKMGLVLGSLENREKVEQFQIMLRSLSIKNYLLNKLAIIFNGIKNFSILLETKKNSDYTAPNLRVWTSGSNMQKNSEQSLFWYDTYEPLSKDISADVMSSGVTGFKCLQAHM